MTQRFYIGTNIATSVFKLQSLLVHMAGISPFLTNEIKAGHYCAPLKPKNQKLFSRIFLFDSSYNKI